MSSQYDPPSYSGCLISIGYRIWLKLVYGLLLRREFYRDYFLEGFDMMIDQDYGIAVYPTLTFGPGQRYASKGCSIVKLAPGDSGEMTPVNDWVTYKCNP